jgi:hypothetical protein
MYAGGDAVRCTGVERVRYLDSLQGRAEMRFTRRFIVATLALFAAEACVDTTRSDHWATTTHTLLAYTTGIAAGDSIECQLFALLPLADSIHAPWSGTMSVTVTRRRMTPAGRITMDTTVTGAMIDLSRGIGDSLHVAIRGAFALELVGRTPLGPYEANGLWQCDDRLPLSRIAPGMASGTWSLMANRPID